MIKPGDDTNRIFTEDPEDENGLTFLKRMRRSFLRGLLIVIPTAITIWVLLFIFQIIDGIASPFYRHVGLNIPGLGFITAVFLILLLGIFSRYLAVKFFIRFLERIFLNLPLARSVYSGARELLHAFSPDRKSKTFHEVCMVEYPRKGIYSIGFITNELDFREADGTKKHLSNVYIPLPPNPTTGILTLVPSDEVISLSMSVEQGLKLVLSAGIVTPPEFSQIKKEELYDSR
ncbi:MAG: DUF502 domain-containing protein [Balneolaceae bacterium]